jgi:hypothetical protein
MWREGSGRGVNKGINECLAREKPYSYFIKPFD